MNLKPHQKSMLHRFYAYGFLKNLQFFTPFILLFFTREKNLSLTQFGLLIGIREVAIVLLEVPTGIVADVTGRRRAMMLCFLSYIASFLVITFSASFAMFTIGMVLFAMGETFRSGTHKAMIMEHLEREDLLDQKVHYYGRTRAASRTGSAVVALLAAAVYYFFGLRWVFLATIVPYCAALILMATYPRELDGQIEDHPITKRMKHHVGDTIGSIRRTPGLARMLVNSSVCEAFFKVSKDYLQIVVFSLAIAWGFLTEGQVQTVTQGGDSASMPKVLSFAVLMGVVYFFVHLNEMVSSIYSGRLVERMRNMAHAMNRLYWLFSAAFALTGLCLAVAVFGGPWPQVGLVCSVVLMFFFYTVNNLRKPAVVGYLSECIDKKQRATVLSVMSELKAIVAFTIAPLLGYLADHAPMLGQKEFSPWVFVAGSCVLFVLGFALRIPESARTPEEHETAGSEAA